MKRVVLASLLIVGCSTIPVHNSGVTYPPIKIESTISDVNHAFDKLSKGLFDSINTATKLADTPEDKKAVDDLRGQYEFMITELKDNLISIENNAHTLQDRVSALELTKARLDVEVHSLSVANTTLTNQHIQEQSLITKWRTIGLSCIFGILAVVGLKIYSLFTGGPVTSIVKKFL